MAIFGAFNYPYPNVIFSIWVKGLDKKCVVRGVVLEVLFWLFLVHLIIITQMLFSLFSRWGGVLLSERVWISIRNGWVRGVFSEVLF